MGMVTMMTTTIMRVVVVVVAVMAVIMLFISPRTNLGEKNSFNSERVPTIM